jgi:predicted esterase
MSHIVLLLINNNRYCARVPREQTETLFGFFKKAGANVVLHFQQNSGHELGYNEISAAKDWLSNLPKNSP